MRAALPDRKASRHTLRQAVERYLTKTLPHKSRNKDRANPTRLLTWWADTLGDYAISQITPAVIVEQRDALLDGRRSPATVNRYLAALGALCRTMHREWGWLQINPMERVLKLSEAKGRKRFLSDEERKTLLAACKASDSDMLYPVVVLALSTGMRQGEIMGLTWDAVDLRQGRITLHETKNDEVRVLPLTGHALTVMQDYAKVRRIDTPFVFPSKTGIKGATLRQSWSRAIERAGIEDFRFHDLRHSAASYLAMNGASLAEIAEVLGHKTLAMVKRYSHLSEAHTTGVVERTNRMLADSSSPMTDRTRERFSITWDTRTSSIQ